MHGIVGRKVRRTRVADHVDIARNIHGNSVAGIAAAASEICRIGEHGIDDQGFIAVVVSDLKTDVAVGAGFILCDYITMLAVDLLICHGCPLDHLAAGYVEHKIPGLIECKPPLAFEAELYHTQIDPRSNYEIIFKLTLVAAMKDKVNSRIDRFVTDAAI